MSNALWHPSTVSEPEKWISRHVGADPIKFSVYNPDAHTPVTNAHTSVTKCLDAVGLLS